jgi:hypothetical protein
VADKSPDETVSQIFRSNGQVTLFKESQVRLLSLHRKVVHHPISEVKKIVSLRAVHLKIREGAFHEP